MRNIKTRQELIKLYIDFFKSKQHKEIPNSSLIPENDPTVLFTTAGMHPIVPYLLGEKHPLGKRLVNVQKCVRTQDIEEVGDSYHHTFFEMLGNWSLGDYFKKQAIEFSFEFLTKILEIPVEKLAVTCFAGDENAEKDTEAASIWNSLGISKDRIVFLEKKDNWWGPAGNTGPCGPDTEMFYWKSKNKKPSKKFNPQDKNWVEIWNDVLMQYNKNSQGEYKEAKQKNIDTGMGVERTLAILQGYEDNYETEIWQPIIKEIEKISGKKYKEGKVAKHMRIIADHIKASVFILADGITPSNTEQGYVLRRLIRRAVRYGHTLEIKNFVKKVAEPIFKIYPDYPKLKSNKKMILEELTQEEKRFEKVLQDGMKKAEKIFRGKKPIKKEKFVKLMQMGDKMVEILKNLWKKKREGKGYSIKEANISEKEIDEATITGKEAFDLYQSYGLPMEIILDLAIEKNLLFHRGEFKRELEKHQELSRTSAQGKFKSGLADNSEQTAKLHTATHLLHSALRQVLGHEVEQRGSNITSDRLRFDFNYNEKLAENQIKEIEEIVNKNINQNLQVERQELTLEQAKKSGAIGIFEHKYQDKVSVYTISDKKGKIISREICAGPHCKNTSQLGKFKIIKEESSAKGIRRIKAVLE